MSAQFKIGDSPKRREDARFVVGGGAYLDDLRFEGLTHAVFVRSPHAHALVRGIDSAAAKAAPGVLAVLTIGDADADGLQPMQPGVVANVQTGEPFAFIPQPLLARDKVRFVGEPVVLVVAETKAQAMDAAELVAVDYAPLPAVTTHADALAPGAPLVADSVPGNLCLDWRHGDGDAVERAMASAAHVVTHRFVNHRIVTNPMEPRGVVGAYDPAEDRYTAHVSAQAIHNNRDFAARWLGVKPDRLRFVMPDVGGGFGAKNFSYPEHALIPWAARRVGRPVKWIATRSEVFLSDHQARDHHAEATLALDAEGHFLALRVSSVACLGGYMAGGAGGLQTFQYPHLQGTVYTLPAIEIHVQAVLTNQTPIGVTRGPGFGETVNILERLIDVAARQSGIDRAVLRRQNLVRVLPMTNAFGFVVDSGQFSACFEGALAKADLDGFAARRAGSEARGALRGLGYACHIKGTGGPPSENVDIRFEADGTVSLITGTQTIGQGHETTFPQILAHRLGIPNDRIRLRQGDTDQIPMGGGHGSSRATYMGGHGDLAGLGRNYPEGRDDRGQGAGCGRRGRPVRGWCFSCRRHQPHDRHSRRRGSGTSGECAAGYVSSLDAGRDDVSQRHPCGGGGDRSGNRAGDAGTLYCRGRLRGAGEPDDRRRAGARGDRSRQRAGVDGGSGLRSAVRPAVGGDVHGLCDASGGGFAFV